MTKYVKFDEHGICTGEAPFQIEKDGMLIRGYNQPTNEKMLLEDGYVKYEGECFPFKLRFENGKIIELKEIKLPLLDVPISGAFTKIQIRHSMRELGYEDRLDWIIAHDTSFKNDWNDSIHINLNDNVFKHGFEEAKIDDKMICEIISNIKE